MKGEIRMNKIVDKIKYIPNLYHTQGCTTTQINQAQNELGLAFNDEIIDYIKKYGAISFFGTEWTGLNVDEYLDVVEKTKEERALNPNFPKDCIVIENLAIDGIVMALDEKGHVYSIQYGNKKLLCNSLSDYLDICISRSDNKL